MCVYTFVSLVSAITRCRQITLLKIFLFTADGTKYTKIAVLQFKLDENKIQISIKNTKKVGFSK